MTTTHLAVGKSGDKPKQPKLSYTPADKKRFIIEVTWWKRLQHWPTSLAQVLDPKFKGQNPSFTQTPVMRESRYCESFEEVQGFIEHCKAYRALDQPVYILKVAWEVFALSDPEVGEHEFAPVSQPS